MVPCLRRVSCVTFSGNVVLASLLMGGIGELGNVLRKQNDTARAVEKYREAIAEGEALRQRGVLDPRLDQKIEEIRELLASAQAQ